MAGDDDSEYDLRKLLDSGWAKLGKRAKKKPSTPAVEVASGVGAAASSTSVASGDASPSGTSAAGRDTVLSSVAATGSNAAPSEPAASSVAMQIEGGAAASSEVKAAVPQEESTPLSQATLSLSTLTISEPALVSSVAESAIASDAGTASAANADLPRDVSSGEVPQDANSAAEQPDPLALVRKPSAADLAERGLEPEPDPDLVVIEESPSPVAVAPAPRVSQASLPARASVTSAANGAEKAKAADAADGNELRKMLDVGWKKTSGTKRKAVAGAKLWNRLVEESSAKQSRNGDDASEVGTQKSASDSVPDGREAPTPSSSRLSSSGLLARIVGKVTGASDKAASNETSPTKPQDVSASEKTAESVAKHKGVPPVAKAPLTPAPKVSAKASSKAVAKPSAKAPSGDRPTAAKAPQPMTLRQTGKTLDLKKKIIYIGMTAPPVKAAAKFGTTPKERGGAKSFVPAVSKMSSASKMPPRPKPSSSLGASSSADAEGRAYSLQEVVVDFASVGNAYSADGGAFDWQGVRLCIRHLKDVLKVKVIGVFSESLMGSDFGSMELSVLPFDIRVKCDHLEELVPAEDEDDTQAQQPKAVAVVAEASRRNCRFIIDSESDLVEAASENRCQDWLEGSEKILRMQYTFDSSKRNFRTPQWNAANIRGVKPLGL